MSGGFGPLGLAARWAGRLLFSSVLVGCSGEGGGVNASAVDSSLL